MDIQYTRSDTDHVVALRPSLSVRWVLEQEVWTHPGSCEWTGLGKRLSPGPRYISCSFLNRELQDSPDDCWHHVGLEGKMGNPSPR